jgi:ElaB/YqjD/DUF883 family membrane-anchored ribosome-binding protein
VDSELEVIRDEMEETRANLANKLEALETQVRETVSDASEAVASTVEGVKDVVETVSETVGSVTETFNISKQVEEHPWAAVGIAMAAGFLASQLFGGSSEPAPRPRQEPAPPPPPQPQPQPQLQPQPQPQAAAPSAPSSGGILPSLESLMPDMNGVLATAVTGLSSLAVGTLMGVVREVAVNGLPPEWKGELTNMIDNITTQLGGKTLKAEPKRDDNQQQPQPPPDERLARLEDLPSPLPPHQENVTQPEGGDDTGQKSRRGGSKPVGHKV